MSHDHHAHEHPHVHVAAEEPRLAPSRQGTVVLDIGDGIGALVVHTTSALAGVEIEIARAGEHTQFVHTEVRERVLPDRSVYAGVFPDVPEGDYTLLDVAGHGRHDVTIRSGRVTEVDLSHR
jgi:hypothetical protein